ncbi:MAG: hypothetical protein ACJAUP_001342 [Cellvibrionaceae bacterium]|jgi:hypothetical protein
MPAVTITVCVIIEPHHSNWVNQYAIGSKASAFSLYLVFYYLGTSIGNNYLDPFFRLGTISMRRQRCDADIVCQLVGHLMSV